MKIADLKVKDNLEAKCGMTSQTFCTFGLAIPIYQFTILLNVNINGIKQSFGNEKFSTLSHLILELCTLHMLIRIP